MATWLDGPEYAPTARPDEFAEPTVAPLESPPPVALLAGAPLERPRFREPAVPVAPLEALVAAPLDQRDPAQAFEVVSSTVTSGGPWAGPFGSTPVPVAEPAPPAATGWPAPAAGSPVTSPFPTASFPRAPVREPSGFPQPGTPQWFGPNPYGEQPPRARADARAVWSAATPGLLLVLAIAVLIKVLAPVLLVTAFVLARRVLVARAAVQRTFLIALGTMGTFAVIGLFTDPIGFGDWWSFLGAWSRLTSLGSLASTLLLVRRALLAGETPAPPPGPYPPPPGYRGPWG